MESVYGEDCLPSGELNVARSLQIEPRWPAIIHSTNAY